MTLLDKAKVARVAAEKAAVRGKQGVQHGVQQGQAKIDAIQTKRKADALLRELGSAYYVERIHGGSHDVVESALEALQRHEQEHGTVDPQTDEPTAGAAAE